MKIIPPPKQAVTICEIYIPFRSHYGTYAPNKLFNPDVRPSLDQIYKEFDPLSRTIKKIISSSISPAIDLDVL